MKMKKLLALVLSAVMAVSMLAACGGGGGSLNVSELNNVISSYDGGFTVKTSGEFNSAMRATANKLVDIGAFNQTVATNTLKGIRDYPISTDTMYADGVAFTFSNDDLVGSGLSIEGALGIALVAANNEIKAKFGADTMAALEAIGASLDYYVAAYKVTSKTGTEYWVAGVEIRMSI